MKKQTLLFVFLFSFSVSSLFAAALHGTVKDAAGRPITGAMVSTAEAEATTDENGAFVMDVLADSVVLRVMHPGFASVERAAKPGDDIAIVLVPELAESITVSAGIRAVDETPVTKTDIPHERIAEQYHGQDVPMLLRDAPAINAYSESGVGGSGYSYINLRGVSPSRINFTLDGVPLADSEDFGTYFADFPDLARSLESIQVQRGVGTSTVGSPSFGGSVNMESIAFGEEGVAATLATGSFGNRQASVGYQTGTLPGGITAYARLSALESDGFRDNSAMKQRNLFVSAQKQFELSELRLTGFSGHEAQQLSFYATDEETLRQNVRANPLRPEERDAFSYDLAQLQYVRHSADYRGTTTASIYYQRGYGSYQLFDFGTDVLRDYGLDGMLFGTLVTFGHEGDRLTTNFGVHVNRFEREHTRDDLSLGKRDYENYGVKDEENAFAKFRWDLGNWHPYLDAQVRTTSFDYHGDVSIDPIRWAFFNPKLGVRYDLDAKSGVYASAGMSTREPTRNDLFLGEDDASVSHDLHAVKPERLYDFEAGYDLRRGGLTLATNLYAMEFRNEIAATGELSDIGLALRRNVDRSYRRGVEVDATWTANQFRFRTVGNLSRNRIGEWTQFYDVYDIEGNWTGSRPVTYANVQPLLTPSVLVNQSIDWLPNGKTRVGVTGRYAASSFLDNTNNRDFRTPSYFILDATAAVDVTSWARVTLQVNNLFDNDRIYASGYSYLYFSGDALNGTRYYYPQATRNAVVMMDLKF